MVSVLDRLGLRTPPLPQPREQGLEGGVLQEGV